MYRNVYRDMQPEAEPPVITRPVTLPCECGSTLLSSNFSQCSAHGCLTRLCRPCRARHEHHVHGFKWGFKDRGRVR